MSRQEFFDTHATRWDDNAKEDIGPRLARVVADSDVRPGDRILDVGTGTGVLMPYLLDAVGSEGRVVALDNSREMIRAAREKGFPDNVALVELDIQDTGLPDGDFDRVICNAAFPHFADKALALAEMIRVLRPGGLLAISHPIGRDAVNKLHRDADDAVAEDRVPSAAIMWALMEEAGLVDVRVADESDYYCAVGRKPAQAA